jgi:hypothetical protein
LPRASLFKAPPIPCALTLLENSNFHLSQAGASVFACLVRDPDISRKSSLFLLEPAPHNKRRRKESVAERAHSLCLDLAVTMVNRKQHDDLTPADDDDGVDLSSLLHTLLYALWGMTGLLMTHPHKRRLEQNLGALLVHRRIPAAGPDASSGAYAP